MSRVDELRKVKEILLERGWTKGRYLHPISGSVCFVGAINVMEHGHPTMDTGSDLKDYILRYINKTRSQDWLYGDDDAESFRGIPLWNDGVANSIDDVIDLLDELILLEGSKDAGKSFATAGEST